MIRIGILTYYASINYGAFLQAYALQECLKKNYGKSVNVEVINFETKISHEMYLNRIFMEKDLFWNKLIVQYDKFLQSREWLQLSKGALITDNIKQVESYLKGKYDIIVAGSDEIWKMDSCRGFPTAYWLNFDLEKTVCMAYAVSGRNNYQNSPSWVQEYIEASIKRFAYIGTRDEVTRRELLKIVDRDIDRNCDPVLLIPEIFRVKDKGKVKEDLREKFGVRVDKPLISLMLGHNKEVAGQLYKMLKYDNCVINLYEPNANIENSNLISLSPFEWSNVIGISDLVITDFFHGTVFSLLQGVPFFSLEWSEKGRGKIENFLLENNMRDKFIYQRDYNNDDRKLAIDLYTKGRKEMKIHNKNFAEEIVRKENAKSHHFFEVLGRLMEHMKTGYKGGF